MEEIADRTKFLGGSDMAALLGLSKWTTPFQLWEQKLGIAPETEDDEQREKVLKRGKRLEPIVMEMLTEEYDLALLGRNRIYFDSTYDFLRAEIDFEYQLSDGSIANGDVKTVHPFAASEWGESLTDQVPPYYVAQFQHGMGITGAKVCAVAALIGADDLRLYYVPRDEEIIAMLRERALAFWTNHVLAEVAPPMTTAEDADRMLKRFGGVSVRADSETMTALLRLKGVKAAMKRLETAKDGFETRIKLVLASASENNESGKFELVDTAGKTLATWNPQTATRVDAKKVKALYPDIVEEISSTSTFRVLRLKGEK